MRISIGTAAQARARTGLRIVPVLEGQLAVLAKRHGFSAETARKWSFAGKTGQVYHTEQGRRQFVLFGIGKASDLTLEGVRIAVARVLRDSRLLGSGIRGAILSAQEMIAGDLQRSDVLEAVAESASLSGYRFSRLKGKGTTEEPSAFPRTLMVIADRLSASDRRCFRDGLTMAKWTNWARDLLHQGQSHMPASKLAAAARRAAKTMSRVRCSVLSLPQIQRLKMGLLLAVNRGSTEPPKFIVLQYRGAAASKRPVCLVGKGLTFDTGGYNLKPGDSQRDMHMDKGGGVGVLAAFFAAVDMRVKQNIVCLVPSTDNRISADAMVVNDVYTGCSGITVEIGNTDAEGRLILADALAYAKKFNPTHVLDMATLTGAAVVAVGDHATAMFSNDDKLAAQLSAHAVQSGELLWRMPLWDSYSAKLKSQVADVRNVGDRWGGAITAALFLQRFVPKGVKWCHLDMAGRTKAVSGHQDYYQLGHPYGFGPRLLGRWLRAL